MSRDISCHSETWKNLIETRDEKSFTAEFFPLHTNGVQEDAHEMLTLLLDAMDPPVGSNGAAAGNKELPSVWGGMRKRKEVAREQECAYSLSSTRVLLCVCMLCK